MVKTKKVNMVCGLVLAGLLCGCGKQADGLVLIGEGVPAQASGAAGQTQSAVGQVSDMSGKVSDMSGRVPDVSGKVSDVSGQTSGVSGQVSGAAGQASGESAVRAAEEAAALIYVYVCGAVNSPGVVELPEGSRAEAALAAAGGFREDAGKDYVNLAAHVKDGEKLYFPTAEELEKLAGAGGPAGQGTPAEQGVSGTDGLVNINTADLAALCTLPGIGESRARDIISYRESNGVFASCEDIMKVPGIKESVYGRLKDKIKVQ